MNAVNSTRLISLAALAVSVVGIACGPSNNQQPNQPQNYAGGYPQQGQPGAYPQQQPGAYPQQQPGAYPQQPGAQPQPGQPYPQPGGQPQPQPGQPQPAPGGSAQPQGPIPGLPAIPGFPAPGGGGGGGGGASGGTAQPLDPNLAGAAAVPLAVYGNQMAPGMTKEGPPVAGNFQTGQTLEGSFSFQPGKCYTLVAQGAGVTQVDLEIQYVTPLPGLSPSAGKSSTRGAQAHIGGGSNCLRPMSPIAAQAKYIVKAGAGAGVIVAQLYVK